MIDVDQLDDTALLALAFELQRDITGGIEVSAGGRPIADVFEEVEAEMSRRQQRADFKRLPLDALVELRANVIRTRDAQGDEHAFVRDRLTLMAEDVTAEIESRSQELRLALGTRQSGGTH